jgi:hypothetical protein
VSNRPIQKTVFAAGTGKQSKKKKKQCNAERGKRKKKKKKKGHMHLLAREGLHLDHLSKEKKKK